MSGGEYQQEAKSSVKISMTAKGEATVEVKVYDGVEETELERIRVLAIHTYNQTAQGVRVQTGAARVLAPPLPEGQNVDRLEVPR